MLFIDIHCCICVHCVSEKRANFSTNHGLILIILDKSISTLSKNDTHIQFLAPSILLTLWLYLLLNSCDGNDSQRNSRLLVAQKKTGFSLADVQSDVLSPSRMHVTAFFIDQQLRRWRCVICLPVCQWALLQVVDVASFPSQQFKSK